MSSGFILQLTGLIFGFQECENSLYLKVLLIIIITLIEGWKKMKADAVFEGGGSGELLLLERFKQWKRKK